MTLDILVFAAHPDDAELACSGTILKHISLGYSVGLIDLTRGELGTRGNAELRAKEAEASSKILGLSVRHNLDLGDGTFQNNADSQQLVMEQIRRYKPKLILANAKSDRHPDHGKGGALVADAAFYSGLAKWKTTWDGKDQEPHRPAAVYHYVQDYLLDPDLVIDISEFWEQKLDSIKAFSSQFYDPDSSEPETPISTKAFWDFLESRARQFGRPIGVDYAEGFNVRRYLGVNDLFDLK